MFSGCGGGGRQPASRDSGSLGAATGATGVDRDHRPRPQLTAAQRLERALSDALIPGGPHTGAEVAPVGGGSAPQFAERASTRRPPASVEKLYTTIAALRLLGPEARLRTQVLGAGHLGRGGTWVGDLYLRGGGDPTFGDGTFQRIYDRGLGGDIGVLASQLRARGIRRVSGQVIGDESLFDSGRGGPASKLDADIPDFGGQLSALTFDHGATSGLISPGAFAARELELTLKRGGVRARSAPGTARAPRSARRLAAVSSPPLHSLLSLMNVPSDDLFAEMLTKQLGVRFGGHRGTIAAGAGVIASEIGLLGVRPRIVDGSGLARTDSSSPAEIVSLLRSVWETPDGRVLAGSLPVVGETGTVRRIAAGTTAAGRCIGKTGTLNGVTNLAGYCRTMHGHNAAFAVFIDGLDNERGLSVISRFVVALVRDG
jgi:D-alanyl-D-alanine carboxypeptidase/D-alanyl-D-alanine-endopeptidase (penicillin-binding protein 4)